MKHALGMRGRGLTSYSGTRYQRGHGLGNVLRSITRIVMPLIKSKAAQKVGKQALNTAVGVAMDAAKGNNVKKSLKRRVTNQVKQAFSAATQKPRAQKKKKRVTVQRGRGNKRKEQPKKKVICRRVGKKATSRDSLGL